MRVGERHVHRRHRGAIEAAGWRETVMALERFHRVARSPLSIASFRSSRSPLISRRRTSATRDAFVRRQVHCRPATLRLDAAQRRKRLLQAGVLLVRRPERVEPRREPAVASSPPGCCARSGSFRCARHRVGRVRPTATSCPSDIRLVVSRTSKRASSRRPASPSGGFAASRSRAARSPSYPYDGGIETVLIGRGDQRQRIVGG